MLNRHILQSLFYFSFCFSCTLSQGLAGAVALRYTAPSREDPAAAYKNNPAVGAYETQRFLETGTGTLGGGGASMAYRGAQIADPAAAKKDVPAVGSYQVRSIAQISHANRNQVGY